MSFLYSFFCSPDPGIINKPLLLKSNYTGIDGFKRSYIGYGHVICDMQYVQGMLMCKVSSMHFEWNKQVQLSGVLILVQR